MNKANNINVVYLGLGSVFLILGILYYLIFRDTYTLYFTNLLELNQLNPGGRGEFDNGLMGSVPSFIHVIALSYLTLGLLQLNKRQALYVPVLWFFVNVFFEFGQSYSGESLALLKNFVPHVPSLINDFFQYGVFDWNDVFAAFLASLLVCFHVSTKSGFSSHSVNCQSYKPFVKKVLASALFVAGIGSIMGTSYSRCEEYNNCKRYTPVYLSYEDLRSAVSTKQNQSLDDIGKIYIYQDHIFVNSRNKGVHIFDNQDPSNPQFKTFIEVPGNLDIAIKNAYLYLDSYIDLVVIDISDVNNIHEVDRIQSVFPYDPYQNIPTEIYLGSYDESKGVVIGYKEKK